MTGTTGSVCHFPILSPSLRVSHFVKPIAIHEPSQERICWIVNSDREISVHKGSNRRNKWRLSPGQVAHSSIRSSWKTACSCQEHQSMWNFHHCNRSLGCCSSYCWGPDLRENRSQDHKLWDRNEERMQFKSIVIIIRFIVFLSFSLLLFICFRRSSFLLLISLFIPHWTCAESVHSIRLIYVYFPAAAAVLQVIVSCYYYGLPSDSHPHPLFHCLLFSLWLSV